MSRSACGRRVAADPDDADGGLAVAVGREFDHARIPSALLAQLRTAVDGDVDDRVERPVDLGVAVRVERGGHPGEQRLARPARDEDAVAEPETGLVGVVEAFELGRDVDGRAGSPVVPLFRVAQRRHRSRRRPEPRVRIDQLELLGLRHRVGDLAGPGEELGLVRERPGRGQPREEPRRALEQRRHRLR